MRYVRAMREALGPDFGLLVEVHRRLAPMHAIRIGKRIAEFDVGWYEEPCLCDNIELVAEVRRNVPIPIVTGEAIYSKEAFSAALTARAADILNPDICNCGGISAMLDIAAMAQPHAVAIAPHNYNSTLVGAAATIQFSAMIPNFWIAEFFVNLWPACDEIAVEPLTVKDSFVELPTTPGHGIDIDVTRLKARPYQDRAGKGLTAVLGGVSAQELRRRRDPYWALTRRPVQTLSDERVSDRPGHLPPAAGGRAAMPRPPPARAQRMPRGSDSAPRATRADRPTASRSASVAANARNVPSRSASSPSRKRRLVQVPAGVCSARHRDVRQADAGDFVAIGVHLRHQRTPGACRRLRTCPVAEWHDVVGRMRRHQRRSFGQITDSAGTSEPSAMRGRRDGGGSRPLATHSSSAISSARTAGIGSCQLRGLVHGPASRGIPALPPCCVPGR